eukprot:CFRG2005T1
MSLGHKYSDTMTGQVQEEDSVSRNGTVADNPLAEETAIQEKSDVFLNETLDKKSGPGLSTGENQMALNEVNGNIDDCTNAKLNIHSKVGLSAGKETKENIQVQYVLSNEPLDNQTSAGLTTDGENRVAMKNIPLQETNQVQGGTDAYVSDNLAIPFNASLSTGLETNMNNRVQHVASQENLGKIVPLKEETSQAHNGYDVPACDILELHSSVTLSMGKETNIAAEKSGENISQLEEGYKGISSDTMDDHVWSRTDHEDEVGEASSPTPAEVHLTASEMREREIARTRTTEEEMKKQRINIQQLYAEGHREDYHYEPWEQPDFRIHALVDKYGFIFNKGLPDMTRTEVKINNKTREREVKWTCMLGKWNKWSDSERFPKNYAKLRKRVYKGVPDSMRGTLWRNCLKVETVKKEGLYEECKGRISESNDIIQIDLDINRTFRDHIMFKNRFCIKQQQLFNILVSYSIHNPDIGYCQGMAGIVAILLMYMDEEDAFWGLEILFKDPRYDMHNLYLPGFPRLIEQWSAYDNYLKILEPKLSKHFDDENVFTSAYASKWFLQCFMDKIPFGVVLRLWDCFLFDGYSVVMAAAVSIILTNKRRLMKSDFEKILNFLSNEMSGSPVDTNAFLRNTDKQMTVLKRVDKKHKATGAKKLPTET